MVISLHINFNKNTETKGFEIFVSDKNETFEKSKLLAEKLSSKISKTQLKNRGLKTAPFYILKNSQVLQWSLNLVSFQMKVTEILLRVKKVKPKLLNQF